MFIVHVTPIAKRGADRLSYFSAKDIAVGAIVYVPVRSKEVPALVLETEDARTIKAILRTSIYETKKIQEQKPAFAFTAEFVRAAQKTADHFATSVGSIIHSYVPAAILTAAQDGKLEIPSKAPEEETVFEKSVLQLPHEARFEKFKTLVRSSFAQGHSVFLCTPTVREARAFKEGCARGIEQYTYILESSQTKKQQIETWNSILKEKHPVLIVGTPTFTSIPRGDLAMFIIEREMSSSYKQQVRPYADARVLIEHLAREKKCTLICGGTTVSLKSQKEVREGFVTELEESTRKLRSVTALTIIDSKPSRLAAKEHKEDFPALSNESLTLLKDTYEKSRLSFVFAPRRGIASNTVCNDCGVAVVCTSCSAPMVLHERNDIRELLCHRCGTNRDANESCAHCGSWNLIALGIGITRVEHYIRRHLPDTPLFVLSSDTATTPKKTQAIVDEFQKSSGGILIGTELALPHLRGVITSGVVSSIDSLLSVPDFRIEEKIFNTLLVLRERIDEELIVETTQPQNEMLKYARSGSVAEYVDSELALRKKYNYPPYTQLIKVSCSGSRGTLITEMRKFVNLVEKYKPRVFGGFIPAQRGSQLHALIRVPVASWPDKELVSILRSLPMTFEINVDPERTL